MSSIQLNGRSIDTAKALPLRLRDWKALEKQGITPDSLAHGKLTDVSTVLFYILHKADGSVTLDEVDDLELTDPLIAEVLNDIARAGKQSVADRPT